MKLCRLDAAAPPCSWLPTLLRKCVATRLTRPTHTRNRSTSRMAQAMARRQAMLTCWQSGYHCPSHESRLRPLLAAVHPDHLLMVRRRRCGVIIAPLTHIYAQPPTQGLCLAAKAMGECTT